MRYEEVERLLCEYLKMLSKMREMSEEIRAIAAEIDYLRESVPVPSVKYGSGVRGSDVSDPTYIAVERIEKLAHVYGARLDKVGVAHNELSDTYYLLTDAMRELCAEERSVITEYYINGLFAEPRHCEVSGSKAALFAALLPLIRGNLVPIKQPNTRP